MRPFKASAYKRIIISYITAIILLYTFSIIMYNKSVSSLKEQAVASVASMEYNYLDQMEQSMMRIKEMVFTSALKQDWSLLSTKRGPINNYNTLQLVLNAQERLSAIRNNSFFVRDARAHFSLWERSISAESGLMDLQKEEFENIRMPFDSKGAQLIYYRDGIYLSSTYKFNSPVWFSIVLELDKNEIKRSLGRINWLSKSYTILARNDTGEVIAETGENISPIRLSKAKDMPGDSSGSYIMDVEGAKYMLVYRSSDYLGFFIVSMLPADELYKSLNVYYLLIWLFSAVVLVITAMYIFYTYRTVGKPMTTLVNAFKRMEERDFSVRIKTGTRDDFAYLYNSFDHMAENIQYLVNEVYEKEILVQRAVLKQLQAQINPHFLYNSFYILHRMITYGDHDNAGVFSSYLGKYFKYITRNALDEVPLKMEAEHARTYMDIMGIRWGGRLKVEFGKLPEKFNDLPVPWMILQPLLENAFEYGIKDIPGTGIIRVSFNIDRDDLVITIEDNGKGLSQEEILKLNKKMDNLQENGEITGIVNIHRRIRLMFGEGYGIKLNAGEFEGTCITLILGNKGGDVYDIQDTSGR